MGIQRPLLSPGVTFKCGVEWPKSPPLGQRRRWLTSPISCIVEQQPRVLEIISTLPKGLGKKDNIKASLRKQPRGKQLLPNAVDSREPGEEMKIHPLLSPAPSCKRAELGDSR